MKNRVRQLRARKGMSQIGLAQKLSVSRQALSAIEMEKQSPSLQVALKIAQELDTPIQQIFFIEEERMEKVKTPTLSKVERLNFANQFAILKALHKDDKYEAAHYGYLEEIFQRGYEYLYYECFDKLWDSLSMEVAEETIEILSMHRALLWSLGEKPAPSDLERVKFHGFDGNNESEYLAFARFYTSDGSRFSELRIVNSHYPALPRYRAMLKTWKGMNKEPRLSRPQIEEILFTEEKLS